MPRFRKPKLPADVSISTPTPPADLAQRLMSLPQGDSRALAALSTAIALTIGSAFYNTAEASGNDVAIRGKDTGWKAAYGAARMAVEVAKESSDMFLPLKAVAGAMSVLIKNGDVSVSLQRLEHLILYLFFRSSKHRTMCRW